MTRETEASKVRKGKPLDYPFIVLGRRRDKVHHLALCRHTGKKSAEILRLALSRGLAQWAKNAVSQDDLNALDSLLANYERSREADPSLPHLASLHVSE